MTLNSTLSRPSSSARRRATSSISCDASVLISLPPGRTSSAAISPVSPGPAASSRTVCPGCGSTWSTSHVDTTAADACIAARRRSQPAAAPPQRSRERARNSSGSSSTPGTLLLREPNASGLGEVARSVDGVGRQRVAAALALELRGQLVGPDALLQLGGDLRQALGPGPLQRQADTRDRGVVGGRTGDPHALAPLELLV